MCFFQYICSSHLVVSSAWDCCYPVWLTGSRTKSFISGHRGKLVFKTYQTLTRDFWKCVFITYPGGPPFKEPTAPPWLIKCTELREIGLGSPEWLEYGEFVSSPPRINFPLDNLLLAYLTVLYSWYFFVKQFFLLIRATNFNVLKKWVVLGRDGRIRTKIDKVRIIKNPVLELGLLHY